MKMAQFYAGLALCASVREGAHKDAAQRLDQAKGCLAELGIFMETAEVNIGKWNVSPPP